MKKFIRIISVLLTAIMVLGCVSVNAAALTETQVGTYDSHRFIATVEAYSDYFCAALTYRPNTCRYIEYWIEVYDPERIGDSYFAIEDCQYFDGSDFLVNVLWYPYENTEFCGFPIVDFYIGVTQVSHMSEGIYIDGPYIPEESED